MKEEILKRIDALADKLGVAATHIYGVYVHQSQVNGIQEVTWAVFWLALAIAAIIGSLKLLKSSQVVVTNKYDEESLYNKAKRENQFGFGIFLAILALGFTVIFISELSHACASFLNPEYFAIHQITEDIRGQ